jgi:hypothetical protein
VTMTVSDVVDDGVLDVCAKAEGAKTKEAAAIATEEVVRNNGRAARMCFLRCKRLLLSDVVERIYHFARSQGFGSHVSVIDQSLCKLNAVKSALRVRTKPIFRLACCPSLRHDTSR